VKKLSDLRNVGKSVLQDLALLSIRDVDDLARQDPTVLFHELERLTGKNQDFCVWDVFASIIHEAQTGERIDWWQWTQQRKILQKEGKLSHFVK
jgi:hypothetical protein